MAVTETVKIVFQVDDQPIVDTVAELQKLGKVSQEDAAKFNQLNQASKAAGASLEGASKGAEKFAVASKDVAKSTTEVAKSAGDLKNIGPALAQAGQAGTQAGEGFVSLRQRLAEAKLEVQRLGEEFNNSGPEFEAAVQRAGELADEFDDLNRQIRLSNPEGKIQAFQNLGQGIVGAFQTATGALQAFGVQNEELQQIAQRLQGALNIAQGIQSIVGLKEAYDDVKVVLGFTTAAQNTLTVATEAGAAATTGAATATRGFAAALTSTGIGAIVVGLGLLAGAFILASDSTDKDTEAEEKNKDARDKNIDALNEEIDLLEAKRLAQDKGVGAANRELELAKARGAQGKELFDAEQKARQEELAALLRRQAFLGDDFKNEQERLALTEQIKDKRNEVVAAEIQFEREQREQSVENFKESEEKKLQIKLQAIDDEIALLEEAQRGALIGVDDEIQRIAITDSFREKITAKQIERAKVANESITLIEQKAANDQKQSFEDLFAAVEAARDKDVEDAKKAAKDKLDAERQAIEQALALNKLDNLIAFQQQSIALNKQLNQKNNESDKDYAKRKEQILRDLDRIERELRIANLKSEVDAQDKKLKKLKEAGKEGTEEYKEAAKEQEVTSNQLTEAVIDNANKTTEAQTDAAKTTQKETISLNRETLGTFVEGTKEAFDLIADIQREKRQREIDELDDQREKGLITEEQYQEKLAAIKRKQAVADKNAAIFNATLQFSQALINALTTTPATAAPAALIFAAAIAGANLAKIIATPLPKFKHGTLAVPGRDTGEDTVHAMLRPGEAVIPTEINREYAPIIRAIYRKEISSKEMNEFIESRNRSERQDTRSELSINNIKRGASSYISERQDTSKHLSTKDISEFINSRKNISYEEFSEVMRSKNSHLVTTKTIDVEPILKFDQVSLDALFKRDIKVSRINSTVNNTSAAAMPSINVKADVDTYALSRAMAKNKSMEVTNVESIGEAVAEAMSKRTNRRQQI